MAKKFYVFSTLVSDQRYVDWSKGASDLFSKFKTHKLHPFEISVMEIEWLEGNI